MTANLALNPGAGWCGSQEQTIVQYCFQRGDVMKAFGVGFIATFGAGKPLNKDAFIKEIINGAIDPTVTEELSDETIIVVGDTAVIVETDTLRKTKDGRPSATAYRFTVTYIRRGDHWVALAEHGAAMKP